jgi:hypothetical protein
MKLQNKNFLLSLFAALLVLPAGGVYAVNTNLTAVGIFLQAITLTPTSMNFGQNTYASEPALGGAGAWVKVDTAGTRTVDGTVFVAAGGTVAAGDVAITGTFGTSIDVSCATSGVMTNAGGKVLNISAIKVAKESAAAGGGVACNGSGTTVLTFNLTSGTDDQVKIGATVTGTGATNPLVGGSFSTANGGGTPIVVTVVYT